MTDEEILKIAQGLTWEEWDALEQNMSGFDVYDPDLDDSLIAKGLVAIRSAEAEYIVVLTTLGYNVWEWRYLFWGRDD